MIGSRCDGPLCRAKSGCWQIEKFQEQKKKKNSWTAALLFPPCSSPSSVKAMYCPSPSSPQHVLGWIPFLINAELHSMKSGSCKGIPLTLTAQSSVQCGWELVEDQKVFCVAVSKPNSLPCWIHLNKEWCLECQS